MLSRSWYYLEKFGPGAIALVTLIAALNAQHRHEVELSAIRSKMQSIEAEIVIASNGDNRTDRVEVENLQRQLTELKREFGDKIEVEAQKSAKTREKLIKKGWIEP